MARAAYHPNAYLRLIRNVKGGLSARTKILNALRDGMTAKEVAEASKLSYSSSLHHLRLLERERIVKREGKRPYRWRLTGLGQRVLEV
ncbi:MAG: helix-turn-helix domain-containing protein [Candidatus Alkanophagales archaeon]